MSTAAYRYHHQLSNERMDTRIEIMMTNIRGYSNFVVKPQEGACTIGSKKRIEIMLEYVDIRPGDILLDVCGITGKITEASRNCKEVVVLEPKHRIIEYGRSRRPQIKFIEGEVENIPLPSEHFDKIVASASFHHFPNQDKGLEEMKRVLKTNGKMLLLGLIKIQEGESGCRFEDILHTGAKLYEPTQLREKG
jgi:ubiquinone/menaquinone biosynthesis C-methylase UbiE